MVSEAHIWQKRADLRRVVLSVTNLIGADPTESDCEAAPLLFKKSIVPT
jgi:hypothetical protein